MSTLAVIYTVYRRPGTAKRICDALNDQTRPPDVVYVAYEANEDFWVSRDLFAHLPDQIDVESVWIEIPRDDTGRPLVVPPSVAINAVLDETTVDYIAYLTDDSLPHPEKYERMVAALDAGAKAVYCSQGFGQAATPEEWLERIEKPTSFRMANQPSEQPFCNVDHTQVAHVRSDDRWPTNISEMRWADGAFFRDLVTRFGPLQPIPEVLDYTCQLPDGITARW